MARALKNITATASKKKPVKRATSVATLKLGDEPSFIFEPSKAELVRTLNWYTACADDSEAHKAWVAEFLKKRGWSADQIRTVTAKIKKMIGTHIFVARMFNREQPIDTKYEAEALVYFNGILASEEEELDADGNPIEKPAPVKPIKNFLAMYHFIEAEIEEVMAGNNEPSSVYQKLLDMGCTGSTANALKKAYAFQTEEFVELSKPSICDADLEKAYKHLTLKSRRALGKFMLQLNEDLTSFAKVAKASRKPRKKKPVKVEKLVARVKYKAKDDTYKVASLSPDKIIKANVLWLFNTKYRTIAFFEAAEGGLSIKGTTVTNFKRAGQKKLRKPEQQLSGFTTGAVKALPRAFDAIKTTESEPNGRINEETIILRIF